MKKDNQMQMRNFALWALIIAMFVMMISVSQNSLQPAKSEEVPLSVFLDSVESNQIKSVDVQVIDFKTTEIVGETQDGKTIKTLAIGEDGELVEELRSHNVEVSVIEAKGNSLLANILLNILPFILFLSLIHI